MRIRDRARLCAAPLTVLLAALVLPIGAASAAGTYSNPVLVTPSIGSTQAPSAPLTVEIDFTGAPADTYDVTVNYSGSWTPRDYASFPYFPDVTQQIAYDGTGGTRSVQFPKPNAGGDSWDIYVWSREIHYDDDAGKRYGTTGHFKVAFPALQVWDFHVTAYDPFYPTVQDGYRDQTGIDFQSNRPTTKRLRAINASGRVVFDKSFTYTSNRVNWGGRSNSGVMQPVGAYILRTTVTGGGTTTTFDRTVHLARGTKAVSHARYRDGNVLASSRKGNCFVARPGTTIRLTCKGGDFAQAGHTFTLPKGAYAVNYVVYGSRSASAGPGDGVAKVVLKRDGSRYYVGFKVTKFRVAYIEYVGVTFKTRKPI